MAVMEEKAKDQMRPQNERCNTGQLRRYRKGLLA